MYARAPSSCLGRGDSITRAVCLYVGASAIVMLNEPNPTRTQAVVPAYHIISYHIIAGALFHGKHPRHSGHPRHPATSTGGDDYK